MCIFLINKLKFMIKLEFKHLTFLTLQYNLSKIKILNYYINMYIFAK